MAEHYGVIPKMFSKEWWPYYWMYYKWHTIGTAFAIACILVTAIQCATKEKFDINITYAGSTGFSEETADNAVLALEPLIEDVDGNGENNIFFQQLVMTGMQGQEQMDYAMQVKHDLELSQETSYLFLYDTDEAELMFGRESADDVYMPVDEWLSKEIDEDRLICSASGTPLAVKLGNSELLGNAGMNTENICVSVRMCYEGDDINKLSQKSAVDIANAIIN